ncbi:MAG: protein-disulfide isomerase [Actinobacteria bacterium]|nr:protein-disulfide isomerase [Actinomycetota bacterium]
MSNDQSPNVPSERARREAVREKAQQVKARQTRARIARRSVVGILGVAVAAAGAVGVTWAVSSDGSRSQALPEAANDGFVVTAATGVADPMVDQSVEGNAATPAATPAAEAAATETPAAATPAPTGTAAPVDIRVYVDYLSAEAKEFQSANADQLSKWVAEDAASLTYYPVAMLTSKSNGTKYSLRAASAAACVATHDPDDFFSFNHELLMKQPAVDSDGYNDEELADLAQGAGASPDVRSCIEDETFTSWAKAATDRAIKGLPDTDGETLSGTPTVFVNGTKYVGALSDPKEFAQFVLTLDSNAYYTSTPTPTATAVPSSTPAP